MESSKLSFSARLKKAFIFLKSDFVSIAIYYLLFIVVSGAILSFLGSFIFGLSMKFANMSSETGIDTNSYINMGYFGIIYGILSLTVMVMNIPFYISLVKNINDKYNGKEIDKIANLRYGVSNILPIFNTYWYIFKYVLLIPSLLLIFGLLLTFFNGIIGSIVLFISFVVFVYFSIFRGLRSFLSLIYAISNDDYSEENFNKSIKLTDNKKSTIFWNIVGLAIISWIIGTSLGFIINISDPSSLDSIYKLVYDIYVNHNTDNLQEKISSLMTSASPNFQTMIISLFKNIVNTTITTLFSIYGVIFYFLLMKGFESEKGMNNDNLIEVIEG